MYAEELYTHVHDPARLAALQAVALLDTPTEQAFDRLSRLASRFVNAPVALVTLIDANRQFFKSCIGLPEPWLSNRETPLSHSFCQHNRIVGKPLVIEDARTNPIFKDNLAIRDLHVIAYLGIPLVTADGYVLGSFCVIDSKPRKWLKEDIDVMQDLSAAVMTEIHLRTEIAARSKAEGERDNCSEANSLLFVEIEARKAAEEKLKSSLHEKDVLLQEIYHRTRNNMQVISSFLELQAAQVRNADIDRIIHVSTMRIKSMSLAHEKLYESKSLSHINLNEYVIDLAQLILTSSGISLNELILKYDLEEIDTLIDIAVPCGLIINELLLSCFEHAISNDRKSQITISLHKKEFGQIELGICDNGIGFPAAMNSPTLGMQIVYKIVKHQLHGTIKFEENNGLCWQIAFDNNVYKQRV